MPWYRMEADATQNPKLARLSDADRWFWLELLGLAAKNNGLISCPEGVSYSLSRRLDHVLKSLSRLLEAGLISSFGDGYVHHDWEKYAPKSMISTPRVQKFRDKGNVSETFNDTIRYDTIRDKEISSLRSDKEKGLPKRATKRTEIEANADAFDRFWEVYPRRQNKKPAFARWQTALKKGVDPEEIIEGAERYAEMVRTKGTEPQFIKNPDAWLNAGKWEDELPGMGEKNGRSMADVDRDLELAIAERHRRIAEEQNREQQNRDVEGEEGVSGADDQGQVRAAGGGRSPFGGRIAGMRREGIEERGVFHHSNPERYDLADLG